MLGAVGYLAYRLSSIETRVEQAVDVDIPGMQGTLKDSALKTDKISTDVDTIARRINDELMRDIEQLSKESKQSAEAAKALSQKVDTLTRQYVNFLKLAEDKITVSVPPRWVDELPRRDGTIFSMGISTMTGKLNKAQQSAVEQAVASLSKMLERKTFAAVGYTIRSAGRKPPASFDQLSPEFKKNISGAIRELLDNFQVENYWVDPAGYVYALISLPLKEVMENSQLGMLMETLKLTQLSITDAIKDDFKKNLQLELSR
jgi:outer membrane murein-binding lipoprotein Lpp